LPRDELAALVNHSQTPLAFSPARTNSDSFRSVVLAGVTVHVIGFHQLNSGGWMLLRNAKVISPLGARSSWCGKECILATMA